VKQRLSKTSEIDAQIRQEKEEAKKRQELYRSTLNYQVELKHNHGKFGTMTGHEKKMNKQDLRSFRKDDHTVHAMIPGLSHVQSVGSLPTKRIGQAYSPPKEPIPSPQINSEKVNMFKSRNHSHQPSQSMAQLPSIGSVHQPQPRPMTNLYASYLGNSRPELSKNEKAAMAFE
jgi:hypothetical protein